MKRLTIKKENSRIKGKELVMSGPVFEKLYLIEDLEEQLGISFEELFSFMGKDIYFNNGDRSIQSQEIIGFGIKKDWEFAFSPKGHPISYEIKTDSCWTFDIADFNKIWFLSSVEAKKHLNSIERIAI